MNYVLTVWLLWYSHFGVAGHVGYFLEHPEAIQTALLACPDKQPQEMSCQELSHLARDTSILLFELEQHPQKYGLNILQIQENIATYRGLTQQLSTTSKQQLALQTLHRLQQQLNARLALIRLLESPGAAG